MGLLGDVSDCRSSIAMNGCVMILFRCGRLMDEGVHSPFVFPNHITHVATTPRVVVQTGLHV